MLWGVNLTELVQDWFQLWLWYDDDDDLEL
jgi:hypothetical protein